MMNSLAVSRAIGLALALITTCTNAAQAAQLLFSPDNPGASNTGSIDAALPLDKIASVPLSRGALIIHGDIAQITMVPEWQFDRHTVLIGRVLDTRRIAITAPTTVSGVILFSEGDWIGYFDDKSAIETVVTDKGILSGRIASVSNLELDLIGINGQQTAIPLSAIQEIQSPRAFRFDIPLRGVVPAAIPNCPTELEASSVRLAQLGRPFRSAQLRTIARRQANDGDVSTAKLVALGTTVSLLNLAQLAPLLGISLGYEPTLRRRAFFKQYEFNAPAVFGGVP